VSVARRACRGCRVMPRASDAHMHRALAPTLHTTAHHSTPQHATARTAP
jgi:hypothetical protein